MVLLNQVVQVFALPDRDDVFFWFVSVERGQGGRVGATFIDSDHLGFAMMTNSLAKETQRSGGVPPGGQQEVDGWPAVSTARYRYFHWPLIMMSVSSMRHRRPTVRLCRRNALSSNGTRRRTQR